MNIERIRINEVFNFEKGELQSSKNIPGNFDFITASSEWKTHESYSHNCEALLIAVAASGSLGRTHYVNGKFIGSDLCFILTVKDTEKRPVNLRFYYHIFNAIKDDLVYKTATGSAKKAINKENFGNYVIPYYSIDIQNKYSRLLDSFKVILNQFDNEITVQEVLLSQLRQSILQDAIQGKLTEKWREQNPDVEPASELLKRFQAEKEQLIKDKKIKKENPLPKINTDEIPFEIPESWEWCRLQDVTTLITDGKHGNCRDEPNSGYYFLSAKDIKNGELIYENARQINYKEFSEVHQRTNLMPGDLCIINTGATVGKTAIVKDNPNTQKTTFQKSVAVVKTIQKFIEIEFLNIYFKANVSILVKTSGGSAINNLLLSDMRTLMFALPNLGEQQKIIKEIKKLDRILSELEQVIHTNKDGVDRLLQSVLAELLGEETTFAETSNKQTKTVVLSREIKYDSKTTLMELVTLLKKHGRLNAEDLWKMSKFPEDIDKFYAELKKQIEQENTIKESAEKGYLELA